MLKSENLYEEEGGAGDYQPTVPASTPYLEGAPPVKGGIVPPQPSVIEPVNPIRPLATVSATPVEPVNVPASATIRTAAADAGTAGDPEYSDADAPTVQELADLVDKANKTKQWYQQPAVLAGGAVAVVLLVVLYLKFK
ncbi:hypothetical protein GCM10023185_13180 [Hymenobacter saemangeumensis]|uniref:Uncharacterized protein n=1 Tax=Hymenobacter saemangeumensis TaxID=1084522 RepID=A0ABP8I7R3_9BACT